MLKKVLSYQILGTRSFGSSAPMCWKIAIGRPAGGWLGRKQKRVEEMDSLATKKEIYELTMVDVKPECWKQYVTHKEEDIKLMREEGGERVHVMSWKYFTGDITSRAVHLYSYPQGWDAVDATRNLKRSSDKLIDSRLYGKTLINQKHSEQLKSFVFWPSPDKRAGESIYEIDIIDLTPGSMLDWSNYWKKGVLCRQNVREDVPYAGFFTQLGQVHRIYHIWCFKSFKDRNHCRKLTWDQPDWKDVFTKTVPFVKTMKTGILESIQILGDDDSEIENDAWLQRSVRPYGGKGYA